MTEPEAWPIFNRQLRAYIGRRVDAAFVDDILGDLLLRVAEHRDQFDRTDNPLAWLYTVAGNLITDHYRRRSVEQKVLQQNEEGTVEVGTLQQEHDSYTELVQCLAPMIHQLPEEYRDALLLTDIGGTTQATAADKLGLTISGMKSRVQRGRDQLKKALQRCCEIEINRKGQIVDYMERDCTGKCRS